MAQATYQTAGGATVTTDVRVNAFSQTTHTYECDGCDGIRGYKTEEAALDGAEEHAKRCTEPADAVKVGAETLREKAKFVTSLVGADDKAADAMVRLGVQMRSGTANQADYDAVQDAFADAMGQPRHKHLHPAAWRIRHWWHWHITDPVIYPLLDVPGLIGTAIRKVAGRKLTWMRLDTNGRLLLEEKTWYEVRRQRRQIQAPFRQPKTK